MFSQIFDSFPDIEPAYDYLVKDTGSVTTDIYLPEEDFSEDIYRLYRFLTELEDTLATTTQPEQILSILLPKVRKLLTDSYWLQSEYIEPNPQTGWSVKTLYQELDYPITVQNVAWMPQKTSPIHNHGTWGIVAVMAGQEENKIWQRGEGDRLELVETKILQPGDIIAFTPEAIHSIAAVGIEPTITFNVYGITDFSRRYEFNPQTHQARHF